MKNKLFKSRLTYQNLPVEDVASIIIQLREEKKALLEGREKKDVNILSKKKHKYNTQLLDEEYQTLTEKEEITNTKKEDYENDIAEEDEEVKKEERDFRDENPEEKDEISEGENKEDCTE